jgi:hypothetical protein
MALAFLEVWIFTEKIVFSMYENQNLVHYIIRKALEIPIQDNRQNLYLLDSYQVAMFLMKVI